MTVKTVATTNPEHDRAVKLAHLPRTLMRGTRGMREAGEQYLPREAAESTDAYRKRVVRSTLFNAFGKTVADMTGKVFQKPISLESDVPKQLKEFAEDINLAGQNIQVFGQHALRDSIQTGIGYFLVDMPQKIVRADGTPPTLADEQAAGLRPFIVYIPVENLLGWKSARINGAEQLIQVRILERIREEDGDFSEVEIEQIKVLEIGKWSTWRKNAQDEWVPYESGGTSLTKITICPIYINGTGFFTGEPPLQDLADTNVAHWQSQSDQRNILHVARVPILFATAFAETDVMEIGASSMVRNSNPTATLKYVEHTGAAISSGNTDLKNLEFQMQALGLQLLVPNPGQTATGEMRDDVKENSTLAQMAAALQDALEQAFGFMAEYIGLGADAGGSIIVNTDFGISGRTADLQWLTQAVIAGKLDDQTYIEELKRRGALGDSVDPQVVLHRIDSAPPELNGSNLFADDHTH